MRFSKGTRLGNYEILSLVGAGGMGEVFSARDETLGRTVAIKVLPEAFALDETRAARFEREARVLASLNHPNIATLHGLEEWSPQPARSSLSAEGEAVPPSAASQSSGGLARPEDGRSAKKVGPHGIERSTRFLVMELVEGETLSEAIAREPMRWEDVRELFVQIAEGLQAAHEKGVVHRDLKPANVKITPEGKVKILDFGLAKALEGDGDAPADISQSPTLTKGTALGTILGTASYMSPEQARGKAIDARTDVWAFGCVLYEALTGKKAFEGETVTDTIAAVVHLEPNWSALPESTPSRVREVLARCLRKDPARRLHSVADARIELEEADAKRSGDVAAPPRWRYVGITIAAGLTAATLVFWAGSRGRTASQTKRLAIQISKTDRVSFGVNAPVLSPDGRYVAYLAERDSGVQQMFLRSIDRFESTPIQGTEGVEYSSAFSPDGQWIAFFVDGDLKKVPVRGGIAATIAHLPSYGGASWGADGSVIASSVNELLRYPASGGEPVALFRAKEGESIYWPRVLPGDEGVLYTSVAAGRMQAAVALLDSGERRVLEEDGTDPHYFETGHVVFQRGNQILAAPFDLGTLEMVGPALPVVETVMGRGTAYRGQFSLSSEGTLLYVPIRDLPQGLAKIVWVDRHGRIEPLSNLERRYVPHPKLSPDGRTLAVTLPSESAAGTRIWLLEVGRGTLSPLPTSDYEDGQSSPFWFPDGGRLMYYTLRRAVVSQPTDGSGDAETIVEGHYHPTWLSSDGRIVIFRVHDVNSTNQDLGMLTLDGREEPRMLLDSPTFSEHSGVLSSDNRFLAYVSDESGREEVYVRTFPSLGDRRLISTAGGAEPLWSREGTELFYRNGGRMLAVRVLSRESDTEFSKPEVLFEERFQPGRYYAAPGINYDVAADGRFVMIQEEEAPVIETTLHLVLDWASELERLAPHP